MPLAAVSGSSEVDELDSIVAGQDIVLFIFELIGAEEDVFWFEVGVRVAVGVHEGDGLEELACEGLDHFDGVAVVVITLDDVVERGSQGLEHHAVILMMIEGLDELDDVAAVVMIRLVQRLHDVPLSLRRVHVFLDWLDDLHTAQLTFTANNSSLYRASSTRPNVPVPSNRVTRYLCPNFSPILNLKCGVVLRLRVEEEMELLTSEEGEGDDEEGEGDDEEGDGEEGERRLLMRYR